MTHCSEPWEEGAHVPLVVRAGDDELTDIEEVTSTIDIAPTLLDAALEEPDVPGKYHGISLLPAFRGVEELFSDRIVFSQSASKTGRDIYLDHRLTGAWTGRWKYITSVNAAIQDKLYDLDSDPDEQHNVAGENPEVVDRFESEIEEHYEQDAYTIYEIAEAVDTDEVGDRLQALDYLDH